MRSAIHFNFDDAWPGDVLPIETIDLHDWGTRLRYCTSRREVETFYDEIQDRLTRLILYGSGDFHHLSGVWVRRLTNPVTLVSFDNHPDWDVRPPAWSCGAWVNRALELPHVQRVAVWGCGNFELEWPGRLFANRRALREGRLEVFAWAERNSIAAQKRFECVDRHNWRERFVEFSQALRGRDVYVTVDLDCLAAGAAVTNWEPGLFSAADVAWAIEQLGCASRIVGGDVCGARSEPAYCRPLQRLAGWMDHPKVEPVPFDQMQNINLGSLRTIWPALEASCSLRSAL